MERKCLRRVLITDFCMVLILESERMVENETTIRIEAPYFTLLLTPDILNWK